MAATAMTKMLPTTFSTIFEVRCGTLALALLRRTRNTMSEIAARRQSIASNAIQRKLKSMLAT